MHLVTAVCFIKHVAKTLFSLKIVNVYIASLAETNEYINDSVTWGFKLMLHMMH